MADGLRIPTVTPQDLLDFHLRAFGKPFVSSENPTHHESADEVAEHVEPDLGSYSDGVQRTLTDEQIAIFRHSEIRKLILERTKAHKAAATQELSEGEIESDDGSRDDLKRSELEADTLELVHPSSLKDDDDDNNDDQDDETEYALFLERERREFVEATKRQRRRKARQHDPHDRTISTRRKVREMDEQHDIVQAISYDEEDSQAGSRQGQSTQQQECQGRKVWWPEIRVKPGDRP